MTAFRYVSARPNLEVTDLDRAIAFYGDALGLSLDFRADEFGLAVVGDEAGASIALIRSATPTPRSCYLNVEGVDALAERCVGSGTILLTHLTTHPWGMRDFAVHDPDGNIIAVGERVGPR